MSNISDQTQFDYVRYANCWEDADLLVQALSGTAPGGNVLSIASAGDNCLSLLTLNPERLVAFDLSRPQLACLELRVAAFRYLEYETVIGFLGARTAAEPRAYTYRLLRKALSTESRAFWDSHLPDIEQGIIHCGKFERYFAMFRQRVLPLIHNRETIEKLCTLRGEEAHRFYTERWNNLRWRLLFRLFFSRTVMGRLGRDPAFFHQVQGSVASRLLARVQYGLTELPVADNPYLGFILNGNFHPRLPHYLRAENFQLIRDRLDAITPVHCALGSGELLRYGKYHAFNLSDIFEYMNLPTCRASANWLARAAEPDATIAYWNMLAPRNLAEIAQQKFADLKHTAQELFARDNAFFYSAFLLNQRSDG